MAGDLMAWRFKPGQSGNPGGLPRGTPKVSVALGKLLRTPAGEPYPVVNKADQIAVALYNEAIAGDVSAIQEIMNRTEGKVREVVELTDGQGRIDLAIQVLVLRTGIPQEEAAALIEAAAHSKALTDGK